MIFHEEAKLWHPSIMTGPASFLRRSGVIEYALGLYSGPRRIVVQAGGHIGIWPLKLSASFEYVITFEATLENWLCMVRNIPSQSAARIFGSVGSREGSVFMSKNEHSTGGHHIAVDDRKRFAEVPQYTIDSLPAAVKKKIDAIFFDIEGWEIEALRGAVGVIAANRPLLVLEENSACQRYGHKIGDLQNFLRPWGYKKVGSMDEDIVFISDQT